jgi:transglutaminase-like putative cysteine protease
LTVIPTKTPVARFPYRLLIFQPFRNQGRKDVRMLRRKLTTLAMLLLSVAAYAQNAARDRHFVFHYSFTVKNLTAGQPLRVWIPLAHSDAYQDVHVISQKADLPLKKTRETEYGNWMLYAETAKATKAEYQFSVDYEVVRREHVARLNGKPVLDGPAEKVPKVETARFLEPDRLVPTTGLPATLAVEQTKGASTQLQEAHAIYDYVFHTMKYDKSGTGWGHGDTLWACDSKRGNCTDFHSLFISMARSQKIPARFEIGFPLPADRHSAEIAGYHCWSDFYVDSIGWIPVDISEAWKHPELHDYYFGAHDVNRVQFTVGRDLRVSPPQAGAALNYFVYPYVEVEGKEYPNVSNSFSFQDEDAVAATGVSK